MGSDPKKQRSSKRFDEPDVEAMVQRVLKATGGTLSIPEPKYPPPEPDTRPLEDRTIGRTLSGCERETLRRSTRLAEREKAGKTEVTRSKGKRIQSPDTPEQKKPAPQIPATRKDAKQGKETKKQENEILTEKDAKPKRTRKKR